MVYRHTVSALPFQPSDWLMIRYLFSAKFLIFVLLAISAPYWLVLRSWYGPRFLRLLGCATLLHIPCFVYPFLIVGGFVFASNTRDAIMDATLLIMPIAFYAGIIQIPLALLNASRVLAPSAVKPNPGYAGNFILWPSSLPRPPLDLIVLAGLAYLFAIGKADIEDIRAVFLSANGFLEQFGIWTPSVPKAPAFNLAFAIMAAPYALLVLGTLMNDGLLPLHDAGPRPKPQGRQKPIRPRITTIKSTANPATQGLRHIFSRRDKKLAKIAVGAGGNH